MFFVSLHLWRIRKDGGLAAPEQTDLLKMASSPVLFRAELTIGLLTLSLLLILSLVIDAPLAGRADPLHPPNPAKAPWYFIGIQEMVSYSAMIGGVVIPAAIGLFLAICPVLDRSRTSGGRWFRRERFVLDLIFALILLSQVILIVVGQWFRSENWIFKYPW
jgi:quinol-cytochrome oxidoreductase complex cytochrome b subunit